MKIFTTSSRPETVPAEPEKSMRVGQQPALRGKNTHKSDPYFNIIFGLVNLAFLLALFLILPAAGNIQGSASETIAGIIPPGNTPNPAWLTAPQSVAQGELTGQVEPAKISSVIFTGNLPHFTGNRRLITWGAFHSPFSGSSFGKN